MQSVAKPRLKREPFDFRDNLDLFRPRRMYDIVHQNFAYIGLLCFWPLYYRSNFLLIPFLDFAIVAVCFDLMITFSFLRFYREYFSIPWALVHNLAYGVVACFFLVWTNETFAGSAVTEVVPIEHWDLEPYAEKHGSRMSPKTGVVLTVNIKGRSHRIKYEESATTDALRAGQVFVTLREGLWGYWVLDDIELINAE